MPRLRRSEASSTSAASSSSAVRARAGSMSGDARKTVVVAYQERKQASVTHPTTGEATTYGLTPHIQARLLARAIRGDLETYPPFLVR